MHCSLPGCSVVHGISQARVLEWSATAFSDCFTKTLLRIEWDNVYIPQHSTWGLPIFSKYQLLLFLIVIQQEGEENSDVLKLPHGKSSSCSRYLLSIVSFCKEVRCTAPWVPFHKGGHCWSKPHWANVNCKEDLQDPPPSHGAPTITLINYEPESKCGEQTRFVPWWWASWLIRRVWAEKELWKSLSQRLQSPSCYLSAAF